MTTVNLLSILFQSLQSVGGLIVFAIAAIVLFLLFFYFVPVGFWFQANAAGVRISLLQLIFMRFRKVPPYIIVNAMITLKKAGLDIGRDDLEAHFLAGGSVESVVNALIFADKANVELDFKTATAIDLAGRG